MAQQKENNVVTGLVRFSYVKIFTPESVNGGPEKYSMSIIIDKRDEETLRKVRAAIEAAKQMGKTKKWGGKIPANIKTPLRDGDVDREGDEAYANSYFFNCSSNRKPGIIDCRKQQILDETEVYSGCYGRVSVDFYPFDSNGNRGVAVSLNNVQKLKEGTPLGSVGVKAEDEFDDLGSKYADEDADDIF